MRHLLTILPLAALLLVLPAVAAPVPKKKAVLYHPVAVGASRTYEVRMGDRVTEVAEVEEKDGAFTVQMDTQSNGAKGTGGSVEVSTKGVARLSSGPLKFDTPLPLLKLPAKAGDSWEVEAPGKGAGSGGKLTYTVAKVDEEVKVAAGTFKTIRLEMAASDLGNRKAVLWYAPGVGLVKQEADLPNGVKLTRELKSYKPGK